MTDFKPDVLLVMPKFHSRLGTYTFRGVRGSNTDSLLIIQAIASDKYNTKPVVVRCQQAEFPDMLQA